MTNPSKEQLREQLREAKRRGDRVTWCILIAKARGLGYIPTSPVILSYKEFKKPGLFAQIVKQSL